MVDSHADASVCGLYLIKSALDFFIVTTLMGRCLTVALFTDKSAYLQFKHDYEGSLEGAVKADCSGEERIDLGKYNECQYTLDEMKHELICYTQTAHTYSEFIVIRYLAWIIADCLEIDCHFIVIDNN